MIKQLTELMVLTGLCTWVYVLYLDVLSLVFNTLTC